jgi:phosphatidylserine decarboxylase
MDGRVTAIDTLQDPYTETKVVQIQLNKEFFDVMTTRSPMEGKIIKQWFAVADTKSADHPVSDDTKDEKQGQAPCKINSDHASVSGIQTAACRFAQWIQSDEHDDVVMAIKSATRIFKPRCYSQSGDRIGQGQCCGYIPFAAVIQVSVPASSRIEVNIGDRVRAGSDIIATLVH